MTQPVDVIASPVFHPYQFDGVVSAAPVSIYTGHCLFGGVVVGNTDIANPAELQLFDGSGVDPARLAYLHLVNGDTRMITAPGAGIECTQGVGVQVSAGAVKGVVYIAELD